MKQNRYVLTISFKEWHNGEFKKVSEIKEFFKTLVLANKALSKLIDDSVKEVIIFDKVNNTEILKKTF